MHDVTFWPQLMRIHEWLCVMGTLLQCTAQALMRQAGMETNANGICCGENIISFLNESKAEIERERAAGGKGRWNAKPVLQWFGVMKKDAPPPISKD